MQSKPFNLHLFVGPFVQVYSLWSRYLTLQAAGRRPDLWAGGMGVVAIADWGAPVPENGTGSSGTFSLTDCVVLCWLAELMYEDQADTLRGYQRGLFKGSVSPLRNHPPLLVRSLEVVSDRFLVIAA